MAMVRQKPPFRADHVGSLLRPPSLLQARESWRAGKLDRAGLKAQEDAAIRDVVSLQEKIGLKSVTDGEFRRTLWHADFLTSFDNVVRTRGGVTQRFHNDQGEIDREVTAFKVVGRLNRPRPIFVDHFAFLKSIAKAAPKQTIPSPSILHFRGGRDAVDATAYPDMRQFYDDLARVYREEIADLAGAGCRYLQIDEVNFAYLCDPQLRRQVRSIGEDPEQLPHLYAKLINEAIAGRPSDMVVAMHLCRGNFEGAWVAEGGYEPVAETLFNEINIDGYFLEYDTPRAGDFEPLRFVPKGKTVVLGLVTTKSGALEKKDDLKRRVEQAARYVSLDQLALSPQCGFASGERGNKLSVDEETAKLRLIVETAAEIWG